jgi:hypothetical protein
MNATRIFWLVIVIGANSAQAQYSEQLGKVLIKNLTQTPSEWTALKYPTDNFGVGTMYRGKSDGDFLCATQSCLGLASLSALETSGFIALGGGGAVALTDTQKSSVVIDGLIPKLLNVLKLSFGFKREGVDVTSVTLTTAKVRLLNYDPTAKLIGSLDPASGVKKAFNRGTLRVATGDIVVTDLVASVTINLQTNAQLAAELDKVSKGGAVGAAAPPAAGSGSVGGNSSMSTSNPNALASLDIHASRISDGKYELKCTNPVIVAVLWKQQPRQGELAHKSGWQRWPSASDTPTP